MGEMEFGSYAVAMCVDPVNDRLYVLYENGYVEKYKTSSIPVNREGPNAESDSAGSSEA